MKVLLKKEIRKLCCFIYPKLFEALKYWLKIAHRSLTHLPMATSWYYNNKMVELNQLIKNEMFIIIIIFITMNSECRSTPKRTRSMFIQFVNLCSAVLFWIVQLIWERFKNQTFLVGEFPFKISILEKYSRVERSSRS